MMDELRDYRFYAEDMIHLSPVAIDYIFDRFTKSMFSGACMEITKEVMKIRRSFEHRPVNPKTAEFKKFVESSLVQIDQLNKRFPFLDFTLERAHFERELSALSDLELE